ncbi:PAS domain S-box protein [Microvirga sp. BT688]|uniref:PAS domain-containing sensor histidine kinase n=1 Tax=Microvirga sp. TaxID=1873136 RepID=UPI001685E876|nr:PAS domain S-box protein [Microvirga sp.]MBD2751224.1 PAS domain S-box protein [Microvirga sp.]
MNDASSEPLRIDTQQQYIAELEQEIRVLRVQLASQNLQNNIAARSNAEEVRQDKATTSLEHAQDVAGAKTRIKQLKQTRDSLRASEGWLRAILESATDYAIITLDLDGKVTSWNSGARNILGWGEGEVLGHTGAFFFTPEDREAGVPQWEMRKALATGRAEDERWHLKKDGRRFWASGLLLPFRDGELLGYLKILRDHTQKRYEQEALQRSELIVGKMTEGVSLSTAGGIIVYTNLAEDRLFGYEPGELIGQHVSIQNAYSPEENEQIVSAVIEQLRTQGRWEGEWHNRRKDGTTFITASRITAVEVDGAAHWLCVQRDVTEEKRAEAALRESEERLRISQRAGGIGSFELFPSTGRIITSEQFCRLWGVPVQCEFDVADLIACIHPDDQPRVTTGHRTLPDDTLGYIEYRLSRPDTGETRWIARRAQRVQDQGGVPRYLGVIYDITSRKRGEEQIQFQAQLLDSVREAVIATDLTGRVTYWNRFAETLYGWTAQEAVGRSVLELTSGSDPAKAGDVMAALARGSTWSGEFTGRRRDGSTFPGHVTDAPVHDESGSLIGIVGISYDISAEKQAVEHQRLLINELNHRVKNTLATVQSITSQTLRNAPSNEAAREAIESRLIGLSRAHDVLTRENWEGAYLREIVLRAVEPYQGHSDGRFEIRGVDVRLSPRIALALAMALQELVTNAVKYGALSNETGRVTIAWELKGRGDEPRLEMRWEEAGGPLVRVPSRRGFGTKLIERSLSQELNGNVEIKFEPSGVVCTIVAPLAG